MPGFSNISGLESIVYANNVSFNGTERGGRLSLNGQLLIGASSSPHIRVGYITSSDASVTVTNSPGGIDLVVAAAPPSALAFATDAGTANPAADVITIAGGTGIDTSGAGSTVTVTFDVTEVAAIPTSFPTPSGTATPAANALTFANGSGISITGAGSTVTVAVSGSAVGQTITGDAGGALSPTAGNWSIVGGTNGIDTTGAGSTLTLNFDVAETGCITTVNGDAGSATATTNAITIAGAGTVSTSAAGSTITITGAAGGGLTWNEETGASVNAVVSNGYITNRGGGVTVVLPGTFAVGDTVRVLGKAGLWIVDAPAGDTIQIGDSATSSGGTLTATNAGDAVELIGITADTTWRVASMVGNITYA